MYVEVLSMPAMLALPFPRVNQYGLTPWPAAFLPLGPHPAAEAEAADGDGAAVGRVPQRDVGQAERDHQQGAGGKSGDMGEPRNL